MISINIKLLLKKLAFPFTFSWLLLGTQFKKILNCSRMMLSDHIICVVTDDIINEFADGWRFQWRHRWHHPCNEGRHTLEITDGFISVFVELTSDVMNPLLLTSSVTSQYMSGSTSYMESYMTSQMIVHEVTFDVIWKVTDERICDDMMMSQVMLSVISHQLLFKRRQMWRQK